MAFSVAAMRDADEVQQRRGPLDRRLLLAAVPRGAHERPRHRRVVTGVGADHHVLQRRHLAEQPDVLEGAGDAHAGDLVPLDAAQRRAVEDHRAGGGPVDTGDRVEAGGLACTVRPDQAEDLAAADVERDRVQGGQPAELDREILCLQQGFALGGLDLPVDAGQFLDDHLASPASARSCGRLLFAGGSVRNRSRAALP